MLSDGTSNYQYNAANRLIGLTQGTSSIVYKYSGLGDRLQQIAGGVTTSYTLDINAGLTQVLQDNTNTYLYGPSTGSGQANRIAQIAETQTGYFLPDALGSMRQMTDASATLTLTRNYDPYGNVVNPSGTGETVYGYTGEMQSGGLVHLRARDYATADGRFLSRDRWEGDANQPISFNKWAYANGNPSTFTDPTGMFPEYCHAMPNRIQFEDCVRKVYRINRPREYDLARYAFADDSPGCHYEVSPDYPVSYDAEGYIEGIGSIWFGLLVDQHEVVYDFATMTRANFNIDGYQISDTLLGAGLYVYSGVVGFPSFINHGFSSQKTIQEDYEGLSIYADTGISPKTPAPLIPAPGTSCTGFKGLNINPLGGVTCGIGMTFAADPLPVIDLAMGISNATIQPESPKKYTYFGGDGTMIFVNEGILRQDI